MKINTWVEYVSGIVEPQIMYLDNATPIGHTPFSVSLIFLQRYHYIVRQRSSSSLVDMIEQYY